MTLRESFKRVLSSNGKRQRENLEQAITVTALRVRGESEGAVPYLTHAADVWNTHVDALDRKFGVGWFNVRLRRRDALEFQFMTLNKPRTRIFVPLKKSREAAWWAPAAIRLDYLMATDPEPAVYKWMSDLLALAAIPEEIVKNEATVRDGFWNRKLRKRKRAMEQKQAVAMREADIDLEQDQLHQKTRIERQDILARHEKFDDLIREGRLFDPVLKDTIVGWPHGWQINRKTAYGGTGMLVPLSMRRATDGGGKRVAVKANPDNRKDPKVARDMRNTMRQVGGLDKK